MAKPAEQKASEQVTPYTEEELSAAIDALGELKAQMAALENAETAIKKRLTKTIGTGAAEGAMFRVTVTVSQRETLDMEAVRNHLSPQFIRAHTTTKDVTTLRVTARKGEE